MKTYHASNIARIRTAILLLTLVILALYSGRKAWGLWRGITAKPSDAYLFNFDLNTVVPAALLTMVALACLAVVWYLLIELLTVITLSDGGLLIRAPGFRLFYRWNEISALEVENGPEEDTAVCLRVETGPEEAENPVAATPDPESQDEIAPYLSEADLRQDKTARHRVRLARRRELALLQSRAARPDGRPLPAWMRLLYPQCRRPDRLLLYPALENRTLLLGEIERHLAKV